MNATLCTLLHYGEEILIEHCSSVNYYKSTTIKSKESGDMTQVERDEKKEEFYVLRALKRKSLREIEAEIGVTTKTLCAWQKDMNLEIRREWDAGREELAAKYRFTHNEKLKIRGELHCSLVEEIKSRDLKEMPIEKLIQALLKVQDQLYGPSIIHTGGKCGLLDNFNVTPDSIDGAS